MGKSGQQKAAENRKNLEISQRRTTVAANLLAGLNYREIANNLDVSLGTIAEDFKAILEEWREQYQDVIADWVSVQLRRYDALLNALWHDARNGDLDKMDRVLKIMERQEKLLGLHNERVNNFFGQNMNVQLTQIDDLNSLFRDMGKRERETRDND